MLYLSGHSTLLQTSPFHFLCLLHHLAVINIRIHCIYVNIMYIYIHICIYIHTVYTVYMYQKKNLLWNLEKQAQQQVTLRLQSQTHQLLHHGLLCVSHTQQCKCKVIHLTCVTYTLISFAATLCPRVRRKKIK